MSARRAFQLLSHRPTSLSPWSPSLSPPPFVGSLKNDSSVFHPLRGLSNAVAWRAALNRPLRLAGRAEGPPGGALRRITRFVGNDSPEGTGAVRRALQQEDVVIHKRAAEPRGQGMSGPAGVFGSAFQGAGQRLRAAPRVGEPLRLRVTIRRARKCFTCRRYVRPCGRSARSGFAAWMNRRTPKYLADDCREHRNRTLVRAFEHVERRFAVIAPLP
ncbi:hypothetical protein AWB66_04308 [Caballeronia telluris]|uniref:Uncharacterized protein n=1 Tax=Caballeronia telluris TaxID=326475 RepID=A0A158JJI6_9BURK|nr:hypothetical protein AWB66_04308 [Caballeronia telluris]